MILVPLFDLKFLNELAANNLMILVPLFDLKFLNEPAACGAGTSNRRH
jgi:hypothetical protein